MIKRVLTAVCFSTLSLPALAQVACPDAINHLRDKYGEREIAYGTDIVGTVARLFANPSTGTWTLVRMFPGGVCQEIVSGDGFTPGAMAVGPEGKPS